MNPSQPPSMSPVLVPVSTKNAPSAIGPYSQAIKAGQMVFVSGQIPLNPSNGELVSGGIEEQTQQCLKNLAAILTASGSGLDKVIKTTVFLKDLEHFSRVNQTYGEFFRAPFPARACVEVSRLPKDVHVEIDCIAVCDP